jgi:hypothetical protein
MSEAEKKAIDLEAASKKPTKIGYVSDEYELHDRLHDLLSDADVDVYWDNDGIGSYEYWGAVGYDHGTDYATVDGGREVIGLVEGPADAELPTIETTTGGGGCDGEHRGRCRKACNEWSLDVRWVPGYREVRDGVLWVVYDAEDSDS